DCATTGWPATAAAASCAASTTSSCPTAARRSRWCARRCWTARSRRSCGRRRLRRRPPGRFPRWRRLPPLPHPRTDSVSDHDARAGDEVVQAALVVAEDEEVVDERVESADHGD